MGRIFAKVARVGRLWPLNVATLILISGRVRSRFVSGTGAWPAPCRRHRRRGEQARSSPTCKSTSRFPKLKSCFARICRARSFSTGSRKRSSTCSRRSSTANSSSRISRTTRRDVIPDTFVNERDRTTRSASVTAATALSSSRRSMNAVRPWPNSARKSQDNAIVQYMRAKNVSQTVLVSPYQIEQYYARTTCASSSRTTKSRLAPLCYAKSQFPFHKAPGPTARKPPTTHRRKSRRRFSTSSIPAPTSRDLAKSYSEASNKDDGGANSAG